MSAETSDEMQELAEKWCPYCLNTATTSVWMKTVCPHKSCIRAEKPVATERWRRPTAAKNIRQFCKKRCQSDRWGKRKVPPTEYWIKHINLTFSQNLLKETNNYELALTKNNWKDYPKVHWKVMLKQQRTREKKAASLHWMLPVCSFHEILWRPFTAQRSLYGL